MKESFDSMPAFVDFSLLSLDFQDEAWYLGLTTYPSFVPGFWLIKTLRTEPNGIKISALLKVKLY